MIQPSSLSSGLVLYSGPTFQTSLPVFFSMIAMIFDSLASQIMLSGWKRSSPASYHLLGPSTDMELMCIQSPMPPPEARQLGSRNRIFLASSLKPYSSKCSLQAHSQMISPSQVTSTMTCLLYTSDAADEEDSVDLGGRRIIKKKK